MTIKAPRSTKTLLAFVATAALTACVTGTAAPSEERADTQAGTTGPIAQATQAPAAESTAEKTELSMEQVIAKVKDQGYSDISEIEREDDGRYCVEARNPAGKEVEIYVDAKTGEIVKEGQGDDADLSKDQIVAQLKEQGYPKVSRIERERERDQYWVMASDTDGNKFELHVNAKTGEITRKEQANR
jgi:uncharacterized membrane protein YkoI